MKLARFYNEGELSSIRVSSEEDTVSEILNLFFDEQLTEEQIMLEIYSQNRGTSSDVDELRLDFDRIFSKKQLKKKALFSGRKLVDSSYHNQDVSITTILGIKNEQRYLNATFRNYVVLLPRTDFFGRTKEPMLLASLKNNNFYWVNPGQSKIQSTPFKRIGNWIRKRTSSKTSSK